MDVEKWIRFESIIVAVIHLLEQSIHCIHPFIIQSIIDIVRIEIITILDYKEKRMIYRFGLYSTTYNCIYSSQHFFLSPFQMHQCGQFSPWQFLLAKILFLPDISEHLRTGSVTFYQLSKPLPIKKCKNKHIAHLCIEVKWAKIVV